MVLTLKRENPGWGQKKLAQALRRLGIPVSAPTVQKILKANGFGPPGGGRTWEEHTSAAKDALWALDFFVVRTAEQLQWYLDEYRTYWNSERCHQGIDGRTPAEQAEGVPVAEVLDLTELRRRKLVRRSFAHGLLNGYTLESVDEAA